MIKKKILFVCLGNICRSPLAHYVMQKKLNERNLTHLFEVDSCGIGDWHLGQPSDVRIRKLAQEKSNLDIDHRAKNLNSFLNQKLDHIFTMDRQVHHEVVKKFHPSFKGKIKLFRSYEAKNNPYLEVPDPYYGGTEMFEKVFNLVDKNCDIILNKLIKE